MEKIKSFFSSLDRLPSMTAYELHSFSEDHVSLSYFIQVSAHVSPIQRDLPMSLSNSILCFFPFILLNFFFTELITI